MPRALLCTRPTCLLTFIMMQNKLELGQGEPLSQYISAKGEPNHFNQAFQNFAWIAEIINSYNGIQLIVFDLE